MPVTTIHVAGTERPLQPMNSFASTSVHTHLVPIVCWSCGLRHAQSMQGGRLHTASNRTRGAHIATQRAAACLVKVCPSPLAVLLHRKGQGDRQPYPSRCAWGPPPPKRLARENTSLRGDRTCLLSTNSVLTATGLEWEPSHGEALRGESQHCSCAELPCGSTQCWVSLK